MSPTNWKKKNYKKTKKIQTTNDKVNFFKKKQKIETIQTNKYTKIKIGSYFYICLILKINAEISTTL